MYFTCVVVFVLIMMNGLCSGSRDTGDLVIIIEHVVHAIWITCVSSWYSNQLFTVQIKLILIQPAVKENIKLFVICLAFINLKKEIEWGLCKQRYKKVEGTSLSEIYKSFYNPVVKTHCQNKNYASNNGIKLEPRQRRKLSLRTWWFWAKTLDSYWEGSGVNTHSDWYTYFLHIDWNLHLYCVKF